MKYCYTYEELWLPKNFLVTFRMYQLNFSEKEDWVYKKYWDSIWKEYDDFFYSNLSSIADLYGFVTVVDGIPVGHISWDPRNIPEYVSIGHNCILTKYKGKGYGKIQLQEAINRIKKYDVKKIIVTTNELLLPAQKNYESVGFVMVSKRKNNETPFSGKYIDYEIILKED